MNGATNAELYARAVFPDPVDIAAIRVLPFALGHEMLLQRLRNPLVCGQEIGKGDFLLALLICHLPPDRAIRAVNRWWVKWWLWWRGRGVSDSQLVIGVSRFLAYRLAAWEAPEFYRDEETKTVTLGAPGVLLLKVDQTERLGKSERDAWNTPISQALWELYAGREQQGGLRLETEQDRAAEAASAAMAEESAPGLEASAPSREAERA